jgi:hypothetical protein
MTTTKGTTEEGKSPSCLLCLWSGQHPSAWSLPHLLHPQTPRRGVLRRLARGGVETRWIYLSGLWRSRQTQALNYSASPSAGRVSAFSHDLPLPEMPCQGGAHPNGAFSNEPAPTCPLAGETSGRARAVRVGLRNDVPRVARALNFLYVSTVLLSHGRQTRLGRFLSRRTHVRRFSIYFWLQHCSPHNSQARNQTRIRAASLIRSR